MPSLPRLKNSDNFAQWATKINDSFNQIEELGEAGLPAAVGAVSSDFLVYWPNIAAFTNKAFGTYYNTNSPYQNYGDFTTFIPSNNGSVRIVTLISGGNGYSSTPLLTFANPFSGATGFIGATGSVIGSTGFAQDTIISSSFVIPGATGISYKFYKATTAIAHNTPVPLHSVGISNNWLFIGRNAIARPSVTVGSVTAITLDDGGYGYSSVPGITFTGGSPITAASASAKMYSDVISSLTIGSIENKPEITSLTDVTRAQDFLLVYDSTSLRKIKISTITPDVPTGSVLFGSPTDSYTWDSANLHFDDVNNRLGIGTNAPDATLTVAGVGAFGAGAVATPSITRTGDLDTGLWFPAVNTIAVSTDGAERLRVSSLGRVGIGTSNPLQRLHVDGGRSIFVAASETYAIGVGYVTSVGYWIGTNATNTDLVFSEAGGSERVRITSAGSVGIGVSNPTTLLSVNGVTSVGAGTVSAPSLTTIGDLDTGIWFPAANTIALSTDSAERLRVSSTGLVGINTNNPLQRLHVSTAAGSGVLVSSTNNLLQGIFYNVSDTQINFGTSTTHPLIFVTNNVERARIDTNGNLGIGITPTQRLHVSGGSIFADNTGANSGQIISVNQTSTGTALGIVSIVSGAATTNTGISVAVTNASTNYGVRISSTPSAANNWAIYSDAAAKSYFAGSVGIGNLNPSYALDVTGIIRGTSDLLLTKGSSPIISTTDSFGLRFGVASTEVFQINTSYDFLLGGATNTASLRYLDIQNTNTGTSAGVILRQISSNAAGTGTSIGQIIKYKTGEWVLQNTETDPSAFIRFLISSSEVVRINANGFFGLGINPSYKLDVTGDTNISSGSVYRINGTSVLSSTTLGSGVTISSLTQVGTITTGTWNGSIISGAFGGTGVNNSGKTITLGGNLTTSGAFPLTFTLSADTNATLPSGTVTLVPTTGTGASGTWGISITGNAATVTNGVVTTGSYADPSWITSIAGSKVTGNISGNAATSNRFSSAKTITFGGNVSGVLSTDFAGNETVNLTVTSATSVEAAVRVTGPVVTGTGFHDLVNGTMADTDYFRIRVSGTATDSGFVEFATADNGSEPIYFRQYTGATGAVFGNIARTATILDASGNTSFPGVVTATTFSGSGASLSSIPDSALSSAPSSLNTANTIVKRDASGNFSAGTITASLSGNSTTASTLQNSRNFSLSGNVTATAVSFNGSANVVLSTTIGAGVVTDAMLAGSISNGKLVNSSITINGSSISLGSSASITANTSNTLTIGSFLTGGSFNGSSAVTIAVNATANNTASTVVARDASGNFSAGTITATLFSGSGASLSSIPDSALSSAPTTNNTANTIVKRDASGNFSAGTINATALSITSGRLTANGSQNSVIATATGSLGGIELYGGGGVNAAFMTFHRPGAYAVYFGLDGTDLKVGGWSMGAVSYTMLHSGNYNSYSPTLTGTGASGNWGINVTGTSSNITSFTINQNLGTTNTPTFSGLSVSNGASFATTSGSVGIANSSPLTRLHVGSVAGAGAIDGNVTLSAGTNAVFGAASSGASLTWNTQTNAGNTNTVMARLQPRLDTSANYNLDVFCGTWNNNNNPGAAIATFQSTGNVGIGTTTPSTRLHVLTANPTAANEVARFQGGTNSSNFRNYISLYTTNPGFWWEISNEDAAGTGLTNGLAFRERSSDIEPSLVRLYLAQGGNVGIGTTSPSRQLMINGTGQNTSALTDAGNQTAAIFVSSTNGTNGAGGALLLGGTSSSIPTVQWAMKSIMTNASGNGIADLTFSTRALTTDTSLTERMRLTVAGNVGIGISPTRKLHIHEPNASVSDIGLRISHSSNRPAYLEFNTTQGTTSIGMGNHTGVGFTNNLQIVSDGGVHICPSGTGNVGIGTSNPTQKLHVNGTVLATLFDGNVTGTSSNTTNVSQVKTFRRVASGNYTASVGDIFVIFNVFPAITNIKLPVTPTIGSAIDVGIVSGVTCLTANDASIFGLSLRSDLNITSGNISSNVITMGFGTEHGLTVGNKIVPSTSTNNMVSGTTYYVNNVISVNQFTISSTLGGPTFVLTNNASLTISFAFQNCYSFTGSKKLYYDNSTQDAWYAV